MKATVLIPAFYHHKNLERHLEAWRRQTRPFGQLIVIDDGGHADLQLEGPKEQCIWNRDPSTMWHSMNNAVRRAWPMIEGDYIILSSPDILFPSYAIEQMLAAQVDDCRCTSTVYSLDRETSSRIDELDWKGTECAVFQEQPGFWEMPNTYRENNVRAAEWRWHTIFNGNTRVGWEQFDPLVFPEGIGNGQDECWLYLAELDAGRKIVTLPFPVYHQWHPLIQPNWIYDHRLELFPKPMPELLPLLEPPPAAESPPEDHAEGNQADASARITRLRASGLSN